MADVMPSTRHPSITPTEGGITEPTGFRSAAVHCGIKAKAGALDLAVLAVDTFALMAGIFTTNLAQAAPVLVSKRHLEITHGVGCAVVVNSGCANACTGDEGLANAARMAAGPTWRAAPGGTQTMSSSSAQQAITRSTSPACRAS